MELGIGQRCSTLGFLLMSHHYFTEEVKHGKSLQGGKSPTRSSGPWEQGQHKRIQDPLQHNESQSMSRMSLQPASTNKLSKLSLPPMQVSQRTGKGHATRAKSLHDHNYFAPDKHQWEILPCRATSLAGSQATLGLHITALLSSQILVGF